MLKTYLLAALFSILPISELRGGIPFAIQSGIPAIIALPYCIAVNTLAAPLCWLFVATVHKALWKLGERRFFAWYRRLFLKFIDRARVKLHPSVEKWGWLGIAAFVAIPLPVTGAWTGTFGAWVLGLDRRRTLLAIFLGVACAGLIVTAVWLLGFKPLIGLFTKQL
jgi:uncharacterized membrane protein